VTHTAAVAVGGHLAARRGMPRSVDSYRQIRPVPYRRRSTLEAMLQRMTSRASPHRNSRSESPELARLLGGIGEAAEGGPAGQRLDIVKRQLREELQGLDEEA